MTRLSDALSMGDWQRLRATQVAGDAVGDRLSGKLKTPPPKPLPTVGPGARKVLDFLARAERTTPEFARRYGFTSDYDVSFNYGRSGPKTAKPLSAMTLAEIRAHQAQMRGSSAVGRYQFMRDTLGDLTTKHGLQDEQVLDGLLQDQLGRSLMQKRKYDAYCAGRVGADTVMDDFAAEWASLPMANGYSRHKFEGKLQPVRVTRAELKAVLDEACRLDFGPPTKPGGRF